MNQPYPLTKEQVRLLLLYDFRIEKKAANSIADINTAFGPDTVSKSTAYDWYSRFQKGNESLEDQPRTGRPSEFDNSALQEALEANNRQTSRELADLLGVSHTTILHHLAELGKKAKLGCWRRHMEEPNSRNGSEAGEEAHENGTEEQDEETPASISVVETGVERLNTPDTLPRSLSQNEDHGVFSDGLLHLRKKRLQFEEETQQWKKKLEEYRELANKRGTPLSQAGPSFASSFSREEGDAAGIVTPELEEKWLLGRERLKQQQETAEKMKERIQSLSRLETSFSNDVSLDREEEPPPKVEDLIAKVSVLEKQNLELQDKVSEKEEVIRSKIDTIAFLSKDFSQKSHSSSDDVHKLTDQISQLQLKLNTQEQAWQAEKKSFEDQLAAKEHKLEQLKAEVDQLDVRFEEVTKENRDLNTMLDKREQKIESLYERIDRREAYIEDMEQVITDLEDKREDMKNYIKDLKDEIRNLEVKNEELDVNRLHAQEENSKILAAETATLHQELQDMIDKHRECSSALEVEKSHTFKLEEKLRMTEENLNQHIKMMAARQQLDAESAQQEMKKFQAELETCQVNLMNLGNAISMKDEMIQNQSGELEHLSKELQLQQQKMTELLEDKRALEIDRDRLTSKLEELQQEKDFLSAEIERLQQDRNGLKEESSALQAKCNSLEEERKGLIMRCEGLQAEKECETQSHGVSKEEIKQLNAQLSEQIFQIESLQAEVEEFKQEKENLIGKYKCAEEEIETLNIVLEEKDMRVKEKETFLEQMKGTETEKDQVIKNLLSELEQLRAHVSQLSAENEYEKSKVFDSEDKLKNLCDQLKEGDAELSKLSEEISQKDEEIASQRKELDAMSISLSKKEEEISQLEVKLKEYAANAYNTESDLRAQLEATQAKVHSWQKESDTFKAKAEATEKALEEKVEAYIMLQEESQHKSKTLDDLRIRVDAMEKELQETEQKTRSEYGELDERCTSLLVELNCKETEAQCKDERIAALESEEKVLQDTLHIMEEKVKDLDALRDGISELQAHSGEAKQLREELQRLQSEIERKDNFILELEEKLTSLEEAQAKITFLEGEVYRLKDEMSEMIDKCDAKEGSIQGLMLEKNESMEREETLLAQIHALEKEIRNMKGDIVEKNAIIKQYEEDAQVTRYDWSAENALQCQNLQDELSARYTELESKDVELNEMSAEVETLRKALKELNSVLEEKEHMTSEKDTDLLTLQDELCEARQKITELEEMVQKSEEERDATKARLEEREAEDNWGDGWFQDSDGDIRLKDQIAALDEQLAEKDNQLGEVCSALEEKAEELRHAQLNLQELQSQVQSLEEELATEKEENQHLSEKISSLERNIFSEHVENEIDEKDEFLQNLQTDLDQSKSTLQKLKSEFDEAQCALENVRMEKAELVKLLETQQGTQVELQVKSSALEGELASAKEKIMQLEDQFRSEIPVKQDCKSMTSSPKSDNLDLQVEIARQSDEMQALKVKYNKALLRLKQLKSEKSSSSSKDSTGERNLDAENRDLQEKLELLDKENQELQMKLEEAMTEIRSRKAAAGDAHPEDEMRSDLEKKLLDIEELTKKLHDTEEEKQLIRQTFNSELQELHQLIQGQQSEIQEKDQKLMVIQSTVSQIETTLEETQHSLNVANVEKAGLEEQLQTALQLVASERNEKNHVKAAMEESFEQLQAKQQSSLETLRRVEKERDDMKQQLESLSLEIEPLRVTCNDLEGFRESYSAVCSEKEVLQQAIATLQMQLSNLHISIEENEILRKQLQHSMEAVVEERDSLKAKLDIASAEMPPLYAVSEERNSLQERLLSALSELEILKSAAAVHTVTEQRHMLSESSLEADLQAQKEEKDAISQHLQEIEQELGTLRSENSELQFLNENMQGEISELTKSKSITQLKLEEAWKLIELLEKEKVTLTKDLDEQITQSLETSMQTQILQTELETLRVHASMNEEEKTRMLERIDTLEEANAKFFEAKEAQEETLTKLKQDYEQLQSHANELQQKIASYDIQINSATSQGSVVEAEKEKHMKRLQELDALVMILQDDLEKSQTEKEVLEKENQEMKQQCETLASETETLQSWLGKFKDSNVNHQSKETNLETENRELMHKLLEYESHHKDLLAMEEAKQQVESSYESLRVSYDSMYSDYTELQNQYDNVKLEHDVAVAELAKLRHDNEDLQHKIETLAREDEALKDSTDQLSVLRSELEILKNQKDQLEENQKEWETLQTQCETLNAEKVILKAKVEELEVKCHDMEVYDIQEREKLEKELEEQERRIEDLSQELSNREMNANEFHPFEDQIRLLQEEVDEKEKELLAIKATMQNLKNKVESQDRDLTEKIDYIAALEEEVAELRSQAAELDLPHEELFNRSQDLEDEISEKNSIIKDLKYEVAALKEEVAEVQETMEKEIARREEKLKDMEERLQVKMAQGFKESELQQKFQRMCQESSEKDQEILRLGSQLNDHRTMAKPLMDKIVYLEQILDWYKNNCGDLSPPDVPAEVDVMSVSVSDLARLREVQAQVRLLSGDNRRLRQENDDLGEKVHILTDRCSVLLNETQEKWGQQGDEDFEALRHELETTLHILKARDAKLEELNHEIVRLMEERDSLQLQLSSTLRREYMLRKTMSNEKEGEYPSINTSDPDVFHKMKRTSSAGRSPHTPAAAAAANLLPDQQVTITREPSSPSQRIMGLFVKRGPPRVVRHV
ncbi:unnamed protein product [Darwinula stevensoni]|uniref:Mos1 transposase HTH domain-containing protein n=1 Tax=Darwinula stevensoni TaxID=69355 RepID=A0A7R9A4H0_9CRUS|nr:unnamed protein product [Darwinula stevensoni]CAG0889983.1 unnamed protein product [Darwinula stevensoni]